MTVWKKQDLKSLCISQIKLPNPIPKVTITPMLFLALVENSFKHGRAIEIWYDSNTIQFEIRNSKNNKPKTNKKGIGLQNIKKRIRYFTLKIIN